MSDIERAREAVLESNVCEDRPCEWCDEKRPIVNAALDELVRAVRAAMPCYRAWWDDALTATCTTDLHANPERWCPSCAARAEQEATA